MKNKAFLITFICILCSLDIFSQTTPVRYVIQEILGESSIRIGGRDMVVGDIFNETDRIQWTNKKQSIIVSELRSPNKGTFTLNLKNMDRCRTIKEFIGNIEGRASGVHRGSGPIVEATNGGYPQKRIAFVIGNGYYKYDHFLANPTLDADYVTEALQSRGFDVILEHNGTKSVFDADFKRFLEKAIEYGENSVALFYYAGHGMQLEERDYLIPIDASHETTAKAKAECIEINEVVKQLQSNSRLQNLIIIDACRTKRNRGSEYDFMAPATDDGTNVLYSTKSGDWADDGSGLHSPFAEAFVDNIQIEGLTWGQIAENIIYEVKDKINQTGLPFGIANKNFIFTPSNNNDLSLITSERVSPTSPVSIGVPISSINLNRTSLTLEIGEYSTLTVGYVPSDATDKSTTWKSTDRNVVTVSNAGVVTAISAGSAAIIASCGGKDAFCNITVREKNNPVQQQVVKSSSNGNNHNGHEWVDLGLSVLWATCNVGASKPEGYGDYYAWGETTTKTDNQWSTYIYSYDDYGKLTKYCSDRTKGYNGFTDRRTKLELSDDVASQKWGGSWRMPTIAEINELLNNCSWTWTTINGINGYKITSKKPGYTDRSIFLPAAGYRNGTSVTMIGTYGEYWSSSLSTDFSDYACGIHFLSYNIDRNNGIDLRLVGRTVRPVLNKESAKNVNSTTQNSVASVNNSLSNNYEYVDLGLSVKWATCNIGATKPEGYGNYYAWGETEAKKDYSWSGYRWCNGSSRTLTKYNTDSGFGKIDNKLTLDLTDDVAHVKWGGNWRMPTKAECDELRNNCTWTWTTVNGVNGYRVSGKKYGYTDRSIFLPAAGYYGGTSLSSVGTNGIYWSSTGRTDYNSRGSGFNFSRNSVNGGFEDRRIGLPVRPVCP